MGIFQEPGKQPKISEHLNTGDEAGIIQSLLGSGIKEDLVLRKIEREERSITATGLFRKLNEVRTNPVKFTNLEVLVLIDLGICRGPKTISQDLNRIQTHIEIENESIEIDKLLEERKTLILSKPHYILEKEHFKPEIAYIPNYMEDGKAALLYATLKKISYTHLDGQVFSKLCQSSLRDLGVYYKAFDFIGRVDHDNLIDIMDIIDEALSLVGHKHLDNKSLWHAGEQIIGDDFNPGLSAWKSLYSSMCATVMVGSVVWFINPAAACVIAIGGTMISLFYALSDSFVEYFSPPSRRFFRDIYQRVARGDLAAEPPPLEDKIFLDSKSLPHSIKSNSAAVLRIEEKISELCDSELKESLESLTQEKDNLIRTLKVCGYEKLPANLSRAFAILETLVERHKLMFENSDEHAANYKAIVLSSVEAIHRHIEGLNVRLKNAIEGEVFRNVHAINSILSPLDKIYSKESEAGDRKELFE